MSIAYEHRGLIELAVVFDALKRELFVAARGRGARLNARADTCEHDAVARSSLLATGFPYDRRERRNFYLTFWEAFMMRTQGVRRTGSARARPVLRRLRAGRRVLGIRAEAVGRGGRGADHH